ncbi:hypothetical protein LWE69_12680 [Paenibacillus sp. UKAQ_18]|nr:hypothetical protein [Paenibacillus sp. UKAQ_18]
MKRRVMKKWINRYITPLIKDLPSTDSRTVEISLGNGLMMQISSNYTISNGYIKLESEMSRQEPDKLKAVKRTAEVIKKIKRNHKLVYVRKKPEVDRGRLYMRLITD